MVEGLLIRGGRHGRFATSTTPKMRAYATTAVQHPASRKAVVKGDFVPVYVAMGMILMSATIGLHTALHELRYAPSVHLRKSRRETLPEVEDPDTVVHEADQFLKKSWFRKVAHILDIQLVPHPVEADPFIRCSLVLFPIAKLSELF